ncbi:MAG: hypothetical protein K0U16_07520 [Gammaproteobacteria bacterium]|nr:hypothetical protein [Gammaproteobacteria bacterium]
MAKHRFTVTDTFSVEALVSYEVEFNTETGEAEVVSDGRVITSPDSMRRRQISESTDLDVLDESTYSKLLEDGVIAIPKNGDAVMLHGEKHVFSYDPDFADEENESPFTPEEVIENLFRHNEEPRRRFSRRCGSGRKIVLKNPE